MVGVSVTLLRCEHAVDEDRRCEHVAGEERTGDNGGFRFAPVQVSGDGWLEVVAAASGFVRCCEWWRDNRTLCLVLRR